MDGAMMAPRRRDSTTRSVGRRERLSGQRTVPFAPGPCAQLKKKIHSESEEKWVLNFWIFSKIEMSLSF